jgi:hypothetical protein
VILSRLQEIKIKVQPSSILFDSIIPPKPTYNCYPFIMIEEFDKAFSAITPENNVSASELISNIIH